MKNNILEEKSKVFALQIIKLSQELQKNNHYILSNQLLKSGTSIGANIAESIYAQSKADFISKLQISQKEANETKYWLELIYKSELMNQVEYDEIKRKLMDILRMLGKSIIKLKNQID